MYKPYKSQAYRPKKFKKKKRHRGRRQRPLAIDQRLNKFWSWIEEPLRDGMKTSERRLEALIWAANEGAMIARELRLRHRAKYERLRNEELEKLGAALKACWCCLELKMLVWHHIVPLVRGGNPIDRRNLVAICNECHAKIHPWLLEPSLLPEAAYRPIWFKTEAPKIILDKLEPKRLLWRYAETQEEPTRGGSRKKGGRARSELRKIQARINGKLGGRPRKPVVS